MRLYCAPAIVAAAAILCVTPSASSAQVRVSTSNGDVATYTQKNLIDHMIVGDSVEVEMAQLALSRTQHAGVKDLAKQLVDDHTSHLVTLRKLSDKHDIGREANPADTTGAHMLRALTELKAMPGDISFDRTFVRAQIAHHTHALDELKTLKAAATDDDVQKDLDRTIPILEKHLARARQIAMQIGISY